MVVVVVLIVVVVVIFVVEVVGRLCQTGLVAKMAGVELSLPPGGSCGGCCGDCL